MSPSPQPSSLQAQADLALANIVIGKDPSPPQRIQDLSSQAITAVLNLQTDNDMKFVSIPNVNYWNQMLQAYKLHNIQLERCPIIDHDQQSLKLHLPNAVKLLKLLLSQRHKVYVHCTAGIHRSPSCVIAYLCVVCHFPLEVAVTAVKKIRHIARPDVTVIRQLLQHQVSPV